MRIPFSWLADYVDLTDLTPQEVAEALTRSGLEIESLETVGPMFEHVIVAKVVALEPHPNADKLRLVTLEVAPNTSQQVVCGAPNVAVGQLVAFALDGAKVYSRKEEAWFTLKPATIRGVASTGMVCALEELQLGEQYPIDAQASGIWVLNDRLPQGVPGTCLKEALSLASDTVLEAAIPANRGDLMGLLGVAREVAALFQRAFHLPSADLSAYAKQAQADEHFALELPDASVCQGYEGGLLEGISVAPSPEWMQQRLTWAGMRAINNVVDITNYVMLETGHPLHAFDRYQLDTAPTPFLISVRRSNAEETLTTLDDTTLSLESSIPLVTCNEVPVALAGIKGGLRSGITETTHTLFLESALFPSALIRKASKKVGIRTESSARFERGTDASRQHFAFQRATHLLVSLCGAKAHASTQGVPAQGGSIADMKLHLTMAYFKQLTGMSMDAQEARNILEPLGFVCVPSQDEENLTLEVPAWRTQDIQHPADVVEELLRIKGYDHVPYTLPTIFQFPKPTPWAIFQRRINTFLQGTLQCDEWMTNSLVSLEQETARFPQSSVIALNNAKSPDHNALRTHLIPSMLSSVARHAAHKVAPALRAYEWGRV
ncbi:MAG: phenylalanine--tRNA ligase subunit beta [Vampirovibrionales bacterium]